MKTNTEAETRHKRWDALMQMTTEQLSVEYRKVAAKRRDLGDSGFYYEGNVKAFDQIAKAGRSKQQLVYFITSAEMVACNIEKRKALQ